MAKSSETELNGKSAYINSSLKYTTDYKLVSDRFANQGKYKVFPNNKGQI